MRTVFNIVRNIFAVIGIVLKSSGAYCPDATEFNIHPVTDSARAAEIREYFQLDTLYDECASSWEKTLAIAGFVATNIPHCVPSTRKKNIAVVESPEGDNTIFKISPDLEQVAIIPAKFIRNNAEPSLCRTRSHQK